MQNNQTVIPFPNGRAPESNGVAIRSEGNLEILPLISTLDFPADRALNGAMGKLSAAIVIGQRHDGTLIFASSVADGGTALWLMEKAKKELLGG